MFLAGPWSLLCGMPKGAFLLTLPQRSVPIKGQPGKVLSMRSVVAVSLEQGWEGLAPTC